MHASSSDIPAGYCRRSGMAGDLSTQRSQSFVARRNGKTEAGRRHAGGAPTALHLVVVMQLRPISVTPLLRANRVSVRSVAEFQRLCAPRGLCVENLRSLRLLGGLKP